MPGKGQSSGQSGGGKGWRKGISKRELELRKQRQAAKNEDDAEGAPQSDLDGRLNTIFAASPGSHSDNQTDWDTSPDDALVPDKLVLFTFEELVRLHPFAMDELSGGTISFRVNEQVWRAVQRIKERSQGVYDIMSDLSRDIFMLGLIIMTERHQDILGIDLIIAQVEAGIAMREDAHRKIARLASALERADETNQRQKYLVFKSLLSKRSSRERLLFAELSLDFPILVELEARVVQLEAELDLGHEPKRDIAEA